jgi:hypothetical protein
MNGQDVTEITTTPERRACLVEGCTCKDARIVSTRRASYFASIARANSETADRKIEPDPSWAIPLLADLNLAADLPVERDRAA